MRTPTRVIPAATPLLLLLGVAACDDGAANPTRDVTPPSASISPVGVRTNPGVEAGLFVQGSDSAGLASRRVIFGDGTEREVQLNGVEFDRVTESHIYVEAGFYVARVVYEDAAGNIGEDSTVVEVRELPVVSVGTWAPESALPTAVTAPAAVTVGEGAAIVVVGGRDAAGAPAAHTQILDVEDDRWSEGAAMPAPAERLAAVVGPAGVHVLGGGGPEPLAAHRLYDPEADVWSTLPDLPRPLAGATAQIVDGRIWVIGGETAGGALVDSVHVYDIAASTWSTAAPMPGARANTASAVLDGRIHVVGGRKPGAEATTEHLIFDPASEAWEASLPLPEPRETLGIGVIGNLCVFGGRVPAAERFEMPRPEMYCLGSTFEQWIPNEPVASPRGEAASATALERFYSLGGYTEGGTVSETVSSYGR